MVASRRPVLVADDDPDVREAIQDTLAAEGYETIVTSSGEEALAYVRRNPAPSLILLDWNMAPMNGAQFVAAIARDPALAAIPVVVLTADFRSSAKVEQGSVAGHLMKPVDLDRLFEVIGRYCG